MVLRPFEVEPSLVTRPTLLVVVDDGVFAALVEVVVAELLFVVALEARVEDVAVVELPWVVVTDEYCAQAVRKRPATSAATMRFRFRLIDMCLFMS